LVFSSIGFLASSLIVCGPGTRRGKEGAGYFFESLAVHSICCDSNDILSLVSKREIGVAAIDEHCSFGDRVAVQALDEEP
jgi:hypothetical protein